MYKYLLIFINIDQDSLICGRQGSAERMRQSGREPAAGARARVKIMCRGGGQGLSMGVPKWVSDYLWAIYGLSPGYLRTIPGGGGAQTSPGEGHG